MKVTLLASTILAASTVKQAGDPVNQAPARLMDCPDKNRHSPVSRLSQKRCAWANGGLTKATLLKPSEVNELQPAKLLLPLTPESNPMARFDYRKGDEAKTVQEFKKALAGEFKVTFNKVAKDPEIFKKNPIMVYGERHDSPEIPSLRTPKGVLLLESEDPNRCMPKHKLDSSNRCVFIDTQKFSDAELIETVAECFQKASAVVDLIKPNAMSNIRAKVESSGGGATVLINDALAFVTQSFDAAYEQCLTPESKSRLVEARDTFYVSIDKFNKVLSGGGGNREEAMLRNCEEAIGQLSPDASATIVVGDVHSSFLAKQLSSKFPDRAVVLARNVNSPLLQS